jgi:glucose/mannose transport system permease protein
MYLMYMAQSSQQGIRRIMLPLSVPAFIMVGIFQFINIWNDFLFGVIVMPDPAAQPVTIGLNNP